MIAFPSLWPFYEVAVSLPARRSLSSPHQPMLLKGTGRNPLGTFLHCPLGPSPRPRTVPWARDRSPGRLVREQFAASGKHQDQEQSRDYRVILSFEM